MAKTVNIGMIGAGFIGQLAHLMNYAELKNCKVLALAEFRPELRAKAARRYDIPRAYATHYELLADRDVDAVVVVTPRPYTAPVVLDCLEAGKHVLSEKPMAGTAEQGERLVAAAKRKGAVYTVGYMKRYDEGVQLAKKMLDELISGGELGPVQYVRAHCFSGDSYCKADGHIVTDEKASYEDGGWPMAPDWVADELRKPYAVFVNTYSHNTNLLRYLFGRAPTIEHANMNPAAAQVAVLDFGEFRATLEAGKVSNRGWDEVTEIFFADGHLAIRTPPALLKNVPAEVELYKAGGIQQSIAPKANWTWSFRRQAQTFVDDIISGRSSVSSGEDSLIDLQFIEALWKKDAARRSAGGAGT